MDEINGAGAMADATPASAPGPARRRRRVAVVIAALAVAGGGVYGGLYWARARHYEWTDDAFIDAHVVEASSRVAGQVRRVLVDDNDAVEEGQVLVEIDRDPFQIELDRASAVLAARRSQLEQAQAQVAVEKASIDQMEADVKVAEANAGDASSALKRYEGVADRGAVALLQLDSARAAAASAAAEVDAAKQKVEGARARLLYAQSAVHSAEADVNKAEVEVADARLRLAWTQIRAARDGRVTRRTVEAGNYVKEGQPLLALVAADVWVTANFKETQITDMKPGQAARIEIDAYPGRVFEGRVDSIQAGTGARFSLLPPENATGNYVKVVQRVPVKIVFDGHPGAECFLAPGLSVVPEVRVR